MKNIGMILALLAFSMSAYTKDLSELALFNRCYMHLTQKFPSKTNSYYLKVKSGQLTAVSACETILDAAKFTNSIDLDNNTNQDNVDVLRVFQNLQQIVKGICRILNQNSVLLFTV